MSPRIDLLGELAELEHPDAEMVPEILPVDARLSIRGPALTLQYLFERGSSVAPVKEIIPGTSYVKLEAFASTPTTVQYARISASDGEQSLTVAVDGIVVNMEGSVLLPGRKIYEILKQAPETEARIDVLGNTAQIRSGRAQWTVKTPVGDSFVSPPDVSDVQLQAVPRREFLNSLRTVRTAAAQTTSRPALMQVHLYDGALTACDGSRLHQQKLSSTQGIEMDIPLRVVDELVKALAASTSEHVYLGENSTHLVFEIDRDKLIGNRFLSPFPDLQAVMLRPAFSNTDELTVNPADLLAVVRRVRVNADPDTHAVYLAIVSAGKGEWSLAVRAQDRIGNTSQEVLPATLKGSQTAREVCVHHKYLTELLQTLDSASMTFRLGSDLKSRKSPLLVVDGDFTGILQQMRADYL